jgi:RNA recognition motif-containing protein
MGKKLYVGNLPYTIDDAQLEGQFSPFGKVESARVITDRDTGRSKGFGFVEMSSDDEATQAIEKMNGTPMGGRNLTVSEARPQAPREGGGGGRGGPRGGGGGGGPRGFGGRGGGGGGNRF